MLVTDYTTCAEIRAALGVSDDELEDVTIQLPMYSNMLEMELEEVAVTLPATYTTVSALTVKTDDQARFLNAAHLFATYAVAKQLTVSLPLFSPEQLTDGKAAFKRSSQGNPYALVIEAVTKDFSRFKKRLEQLFAVVNSSTASNTVMRNLMSVSSPSYDPVTGA